MLDDNKTVKVTNRSRGSVGYVIPDMGNLQRRFEHNETKAIPVEEIRKLDWTPGGHVLLKDYLKIEDNELIEEVLHDVEPEYNYTEEQIKEILLNGDMDTFMDMIDFGPQGVLDMAKDLAITLEIPDVRKREAISKKMNCSIDNAIKINQQSKTPDEDKPEEVKTRRTAGLAQTTTSETKTRRTAGVTTTTSAAAGKYKVVSK